ncbi:glycoside hydrolase family 3 protein [Flagellimonas zhangzhouensis]|uniref:beta-N-acetylhexosaminidase n=1 Tax=Flagellimonas zhangzhouensis TaxID=1073328 RepID=A0A1H2R703_9FLAO|nr:glycoside hydrolase family 3 N-terminal domain-containing protein [Allomuricauda zhangzhouensis]SDQ60341.1 beta-glucosidase [Allomuricauda zhangzhouensis]SDW15177.1 beta-glucosidase [Allomuricauda zhangzhouensis]
MTKTESKYTLPTEPLTLKQKVGQLFMPAVFINDTEEEVQKMEKLIKEQYVGSVCFFHSRASAATNFEGKKKIVYNEQSYNRLLELIDRYQNAASVPLLIAIDAEWGLAMRIENTPQLPYAITLGALTNNNDLIQKVGQAIGNDCRAAGVQWNLAPVVDINNNPENPVIGHRSFGDDKSSVHEKAQAFLKGMSSSGTLNSIKHFPGHGDTATDSHLGLPVIDKSMEELMENELYPFKKLIESGIDSVMVGHLLLPQLDKEHPSTTSSKIISDVLRKQLGFDGVVISDALNMHAVSKKYPEKGKLEHAAFMAGMDVLCFSENVVEGIEQILNNATGERINESFERVWQLKKKAFELQHPAETKSLSAPYELNREIAVQAITELYGDPSKINKIKTGNFLNVSVNSDKENSFAKQISSNFGPEVMDLEDLTVDNDQQIVLSIFPPAVKPKNQFGFDNKILGKIQEVIAKHDPLIYLFGNPYVLDILKLKPNSNVVLAYQDFTAFQDIAFKHFLGEIQSKGKLPIQLKTFGHE